MTAGVCLDSPASCASAFDAVQIEQDQDLVKPICPGSLHLSPTGADHLGRKQAFV